MAAPKSNTEPLAASASPEYIGKHYFKQAWAYSQRIDQECRSASHTLQLYSTNLQESRRKLREKCVKVMLLSCSYRRKAEELLWKKGFYELTQKSKCNKQALDGSSQLYKAYSEHLSTAMEFYTHLLSQLEEHYQLPVTAMDYSNLSAMDASNADAQWLREAAYRCLLYLGDLARYRVDIGGKPYTAVTHYLHAISLDPTNGASFNQLAALSGDRHEGLDAVYFYMRSIYSAKPFPGSEVNLKRQLIKTSERLEALVGNKERAKETDIREATQSLLLARLVTLQHLLSPSEGDKVSIPQPKSITSLCEMLLSDLEECLNFDLQLFQDMCPSCVHHVLSSGKMAGEGEGEGEEEGDHRKVEELACLPCDLLLKVVSLCMLTSSRLRSEGSALTQTLTSLAASVFSLLLHHSFLRLSHLTRLTVHTLTHGTDTSGRRAPASPKPVQAVALGATSNKNMVELFIEQLSGAVLDEYAQQMPGIARQNKASATLPDVEKAVNKLSFGPSLMWGGEDISDESTSTSSRETNLEGKKQERDVEKVNESSATCKSEKASSTIKKKNKRGNKRKVVDRRRRHQRKRPDWEMTSDESEQSDSSDTSRSSSSDSSTDTEVEEEEDEEEEAIDRIDSLSETSLSDTEDERGREEVVKEAVSQPEARSPVRDGAQKREGERKVKRQIVLAANFGQQKGLLSGPVAGDRNKISDECSTSTATADDCLFQTLLLKTRNQAAAHLACSLAAEESYLMALKVFSDWLTEHPLIITVSGQSVPSIWSQLATLLNFLPPAQDIISAGLRVALPHGVEWSQTHALHEDISLRGFSPLTATHQQLQFEATSSLDILEQACNRICALQKFGANLARTRATASFQWEAGVGRFVGPLQREMEEKEAAEAVQTHKQEMAAETRSKLMKAMAERRLQVEVDSLAETSAQQEATIFTPYLLPDAHSLCTGLHLIRKLIASEKFIVIIAKSVIDSLDSMKKGRENYAAREAIKFLERCLQGGGGMVRVQALEETLKPPHSRKPPKMDLNTWRYSNLVDCALYFTHTFAERGSSYHQAATTLLLDPSLAKLAEEPGEDTSPLAGVLSEAQLNGVPIDTVVSFHGKWQQSQASRRTSQK